MSDFGEICPLFSTGLFNEITFPNVSMTGITACGNALVGTLTCTKVGVFTFGRTVVVTAAYIRRNDTNETVMNMQLIHAVANEVWNAGSQTIIGTCSITSDLTLYDIYTFKPFTITEKTFTSSDILGLNAVAGTAASSGVYDLIVRYREK